MAGVIVRSMAAGRASFGGARGGGVNPPATGGNFLLSYTPMGARIATFYFALWFLGAVAFLIPVLPSPDWSALALHPPGSDGFRAWQLLTGPLLYPPHRFGGLVWAVLALGYFGATVERYLGRRRFVEFWLVATAGSLLGVGLLALLGAPQTVQTGFGPVGWALVVIACEMTPNATANFLLIFPVRLRWITMGAFAFVIAKTLRMFAPFGLGGGNGGYELGAMALALLWLRYRDQLDPRSLGRRRKAKRLLRAVEDDLAGDPPGPIYH